MTPAPPPGAPTSGAPAPGRPAGPPPATPPPPPRPPTPRPRRRPSATALLVGGLALALAVLSALSVRAWMRRTDADTDRAARGQPTGLRVVTAEVEGLPDLPPMLLAGAPGEADTLVVRVLYAGGCRDHDIDIDREVRGDSLLFTLRHDANGDDCEAEVYDELHLPVGAGDAGDVPGRIVALTDPETGEHWRIR